ncbi:hypothetical protein TWF506_010347 [Arthrobotrys conoides]|uniref:Uncharacterized protein n=1 Tax=Arthrobotrys conoides TaxID=74498 RepID=A0AAN8NCV1_9PEZI
MDKPTEEKEYPVAGQGQSSPSQPQSQAPQAHQVAHPTPPQGARQSHLQGERQNPPQSVYQGPFQGPLQDRPEDSRQGSFGMLQGPYAAPQIAPPPQVASQGLQLDQVQRPRPPNPPPAVPQPRSNPRIDDKIQYKKRMIKNISAPQRETEYNNLVQQIKRLDPKVYCDVICDLVAHGEVAHEDKNRLTRIIENDNNVRNAGPPFPPPGINSMSTQAPQPHSQQAFPSRHGHGNPTPNTVQQAQGHMPRYGQGQDAPNIQQPHGYMPQYYPGQAARNLQQYPPMSAPTYHRAQILNQVPTPILVQELELRARAEQYHAGSQMSGASTTGNHGTASVQRYGNHVPQNQSVPPIRNPQTLTSSSPIGYYPPRHNLPHLQSLSRQAAATTFSHLPATTIPSSQQVASNISSCPPAATTSSHLSIPPALTRINLTISPRPLEDTSTSESLSPSVKALRLGDETISTRALNNLELTQTADRPTEPTLAPVPSESSEPVPVKAPKAGKMPRRPSQKRPRPSPESSPEPSKRTEVIPPSETMDLDIGPLSGNELSSVVTDNGGDGGVAGPLSDTGVDDGPQGDALRPEGMAASGGKEGPTTARPAPGKENQKEMPGPKDWEQVDVTMREPAFFRCNPADFATGLPASATATLGAQTRPSTRAHAPPTPVAPSPARRSKRIAQQQDNPDEMETTEIARKTKAETFARLGITEVESNAHAMRALLFQIVHGIFFQTRSGTGEPQTAQARERLILLASQAIRALVGTGDGTLDVVCDVWRRDFREELRRPTLDIGPPVRRNRETGSLDFCDPGTPVRCSICGRRHGVEFSVGFSGTPYKSKREHRPEDMLEGSDSDMPGPPRTPPMRFNIGRRCTELIMNYHTLRQWERALKTWVRDRMQELGHIIEGGYLNRNQAGGASFELIGDIVQRLLEERSEDGTPRVQGFLTQLTRTHAHSMEIRKNRKGMALKFKKRHGPGTGKKKGADHASTSIGEGGQEKEPQAPRSEAGNPGIQSRLSKDQRGLLMAQQNSSSTERTPVDRLQDNLTTTLPLTPTGQRRVRYHGIGRIRTRVAIDADPSDEDLPGRDTNDDESSDSDDYVFLEDGDEAKEYRKKKNQWNRGGRGGR